MAKERVVLMGLIVGDDENYCGDDCPAKHKSQSDGKTVLYCRYFQTWLIKGSSGVIRCEECLKNAKILEVNKKEGGK